MKKLTLPFSKDSLKNLSAGEIVLLSGELFTARDAAHKKLLQLLAEGQPLPFELCKAAVYYCGAVINGQSVLSAGPTTSARMDACTPLLLDNGLAAVIGKGGRSKAVVDALKRNGAVYFAAVGGAGAFYAARITASRLIAFPELGSEAIYSFTVQDFPVITAVDSAGNSVYNKIL